MAHNQWILVLVSAALAGCHAEVNTVQTTPSQEFSWVKRDSGMTQIASVVSARKGRADDLLKVQVEVTNLRPTDQKFFARFEWFDANGNIVDSPLSRWQGHTISGGQPLVLTAIAPHPRVVDCRLLLQEDTR